MRRVLVDTNVLLSALIFPDSISARALWHAANEDHLLLTDWIVDETRDVVGRKWPDRLALLEPVLAALGYDVLPIGSSGVEIRDAADQPILDAAISSGVDIILTGDKDFHALELTRPRILTPRQFLELSE